MRSPSVVPALLALALALPTAALARDHHDVHLRVDCGPHGISPADWSERVNEGASRIAITTRGGEVTLLLTDDTVNLQLSNREFRKVNRELWKEENEEEDSVIGGAIKGAVLASVRALLAHSAECPLSELRDADFRDGRLILWTEDGERLFDRCDDGDDESVMRAFSPDDARLFVREFRRLKARAH